MIIKKNDERKITQTNILQYNILQIYFKFYFQFLIIRDEYNLSSG